MNPRTPIACGTLLLAPGVAAGAFGIRGLQALHGHRGQSLWPRG